MTVSTRHLWLVAALAILVAASGYAFWTAQRDKTTEAQLEAGIDGARLVETRFLGTADIRVGVFAGKALGTGAVKGTFLTATQRNLAPFTIDYFVALKKIDASDYRWDPEYHTLTINIPDVWIASPNIDITKAITRQTGVWISRTDGLSLNRQVATTMAAKIENGAMKDENRNKAGRRPDRWFRDSRVRYLLLGVLQTRKSQSHSLGNLRPLMGGSVGIGRDGLTKLCRIAKA